VHTHKETFFQPSDDGIPSTWVVFYWDEDSNPCTDTHEAAYFRTEKEATEFENSLQDYDDWLTSQEIPLAVQ